MATTWTKPVSLTPDLFRISKAACSSGDESIPTDPAKATVTVTAAAGITAADTLVITYATDTTITFTGHATLNTGLNFKTGDDTATDHTNLAAAINRYTSTHGCVATAGATTTVITAVNYGTAPNSIGVTETGNSMTVGNATLAGGVELPETANVGIDLYDLRSYRVYVEAAVGAMTAGANLKAYLYNPVTKKWSACPAKNITATAIQVESYADVEVTADVGRLAILGNGLGRAHDVYIIGRRRS